MRFDPISPGVITAQTITTLNRFLEEVERLANGLSASGGLRMNGYALTAATGRRPFLARIDDVLDLLKMRVAATVSTSDTQILVEEYPGNRGVDQTVTADVEDYKIPVVPADLSEPVTLYPPFDILVRDEIMTVTEMLGPLWTVTRSHALHSLRESRYLSTPPLRGGYGAYARETDIFVLGTWAFVVSEVSDDGNGVFRSVEGGRSSTVTYSETEVDVDGNFIPTRLTNPAYEVNGQTPPVGSLVWAWETDSGDYLFSYADAGPHWTTSGESGAVDFDDPLGVEIVAFSRLAADLSPDVSTLTLRQPTTGNDISEFPVTPGAVLVIDDEQLILLEKTTDYEWRVQRGVNGTRQYVLRDTDDDGYTDAEGPHLDGATVSLLVPISGGSRRYAPLQRGEFVPAPTGPPSYAITQINTTPVRSAGVDSSLLVTDTPTYSEAWIVPTLRGHVGTIQRPGTLSIDETANVQRLRVLPKTGITYETVSPNKVRLKGVMAGTSQRGLISLGSQSFSGFKRLSFMGMNCPPTSVLRPTGRIEAYDPDAIWPGFLDDDGTLDTGSIGVNGDVTATGTVSGTELEGNYDAGTF